MVRLDFGDRSGMGERAVGYYMGKVPDEILGNFTGANATEIQEYVAEINVTCPPIASCLNEQILGKR